MSKVKVLAGDFETAEGRWDRPCLRLWRRGTRPSAFGASVPTEMLFATQLRSLDVATEESVKRVGGTVGWATAGAILAGPVGLLAGALIGGHGKDVTFVAEFRDGRKLMATVDSTTYREILAAKGL